MKELDQIVGWIRTAWNGERMFQNRSGRAKNRACGKSEKRKKEYLVKGKRRRRRKERKGVREIRERRSGNGDE